MIAEYFNVPITELVFVGDEDKDRETAIHADCQFIQINRKNRTSETIFNLTELIEKLID